MGILIALIIIAVELFFSLCVLVALLWFAYQDAKSTASIATPEMKKLLGILPRAGPVQIPESEAPKPKEDEEIVVIEPSADSV